MSLLQIEKLTRNFGGLSAVSNVSLAVEEHELVGLIGPNGAGKTTLFPSPPTKKISCSSLVVCSIWRKVGR